MITTEPDQRGARREHAYRNDIQALRGLAVLVVVLFHADLGFPGGFVGVDVFFVISGFVITGVLQRQLERTGRLRFADFYARRARRLLPALAAMTVVVLALSALVLPTSGVQQNAAKTGAAASVFSSNLYLYRFGVDYFDPPQLNPFLHTWSLGVEEQTYLILPITIFVLWAVGRRLRAARLVAIGGIVAASLLSLGLSLTLTTGNDRLHIPLPERFAFYTPVTRFWEFGFGVVLALIASRLPRARRAGVGLGVLGLGMVLVACFTLTDVTPFPGRAALVPVAGATLLIAAGAVSDRWERAASVPPLVWLGGLSYAWYLWHWPLIVFAEVLWPGSRPAVLAAVVASLLVATAGQRLVESPFRYDARLVGRRAVALTTVCVVVGLGTAGVVFAGAQRGWGSAELRDRLAEARRSRPERDGCDSVLRSAPCLYPGDGRGTVMMVGDSHAGAIGDAVMASAQRAGADFQVWTRPACPFLAGYAQHRGDACQKWSDEVRAYLRAHPPDVLVVHAASTRYTEAGALQAADGRTAATADESIAWYVDGLDAVARELAPLGTKTVVVADVPYFPGSKVQQASVLRPRPQPRVRSRRDVEAETAAFDRALLARAAATGMDVLDPKPVLCGATRCSQYADGWQYRDSEHLSPWGAHRLEGLVDGALQRALTPAGTGP